jgi:hypothetical protein
MACAPQSWSAIDSDWIPLYYTPERPFYITCDEVEQDRGETPGPASPAARPVRRARTPRTGAGRKPKRALVFAAEETRPAPCCRCSKGCSSGYCPCVKGGRTCGDGCGRAWNRACGNYDGLAAKKTDPKKRRKGCGCKQSGCLKKYCVCYAAGAACGGGCKCACGKEASPANGFALDDVCRPV